MNGRKWKLLVCLMLAWVALWPTTSSAGWNATDGNAASLAQGDQLLLKSCQDGAGGVFVVWEDHRGANSDIYAQHLTRQGLVANGWSANGNAICSASGNQLMPSIAPDDSGGVIIVWQDGRGSDYDIYAIRLTGSGGLVTGWTANGTVICNASGDRRLHESCWTANTVRSSLGQTIDRETPTFMRCAFGVRAPATRPGQQMAIEFRRLRQTSSSTRPWSVLQTVGSPSGGMMLTKALSWCRNWT